MAVRFILNHDFFEPILIVDEEQGCSHETVRPRDLRDDSFARGFYVTDRDGRFIALMASAQGPRLFDVDRSLVLDPDTVNLSLEPLDSGDNALVVMTAGEPPWRIVVKRPCHRDFDNWSDAKSRDFLLWLVENYRLPAFQNYYTRK